MASREEIRRRVTALEQKVDDEIHQYRRRSTVAVVELKKELCNHQQDRALELEKALIAKECEEARKKKLAYYMNHMDFLLDGKEDHMKRVQGQEEQPLKYFVEAAEQMVEEEVKREWEESLMRQSEVNEAVEQLDHETIALDIKTLCEEAETVYLEEMHARRIASWYGKEKIRESKINADEKRSEFVGRIFDIFFLLDHFGTSNRWRSAVVAECKAIADFFRPKASKFSPMEKLVKLLGQITIDINLFQSSRDMVHRINELLLVAEDIDHVWGGRERTYRLQKEEIERKDLESKTQLKEQIKMINYTKQQMWSQSVVKRREREQKSRHDRGFGVSINTPKKVAYHSSVYYGSHVLMQRLSKVEELPVSQVTLQTIHHEYLKLLAECADKGLWHIAFEVYNSFFKRLPRMVTSDTYRLLITSCKHAKPCNSYQALKVLEEMNSRGFIPTTTIYNATLDACVPSGEWRRAARILRLMGRAAASGQPGAATSVTYNTIHKICCNVDSNHAPDIYDSFKFAGVPETIAYGCAQATLQTKTSSQVNNPL